MPFELRRTKSFHYTIFNLQAFITLTRVGDQVGMDLWSYQSKDGRGIIKAFDCALPYVIGEKTWGPKDIEGASPLVSFGRYSDVLRYLPKEQGEERITTISILSIAKNLVIIY